MTTATAPTASAEERATEFVALVPEGMDPDQLLASLTDADPASPDPAEPAEPAAPAPAPAPAPASAAPAPAGKKTTVPVSALIGERQKRQRLAGDYQSLLRDYEALQAQARLNATMGGIEFTEAEKAEIKKRADEAASMGEVAEIVIDVFQKKTTVAERQKAFVTRKQELDRMEADFKGEHPDYDEMLERSGIAAAVAIDPATGRNRNPVIAKEIYSAANPIQRAYELAIGALEHQGKLEPIAEEPSAEPSAPAPAPAGGAPAAAAPAPRPAPSVPAATPPERPRGVSALPRTGGGPARVSFHDRTVLDRLMETNFDAYQRLMEANPGLEMYHLGGSDRP